MSSVDCSFLAHAGRRTVFGLSICITPGLWSPSKNGGKFVRADFNIHPLLRPWRPTKIIKNFLTSMWSESEKLFLPVLSDGSSCGFGLGRGNFSLWGKFKIFIISRLLCLQTLDCSWGWSWWSDFMIPWNCGLIKIPQKWGLSKRTSETNTFPFRFCSKVSDQDYPQTDIMV